MVAPLLSRRQGRTDKPDIIKACEAEIRFSALFMRILGGGATRRFATSELGHQNDWLSALSCRAPKVCCCWDDTGGGAAVRSLSAVEICSGPFHWCVALVFVLLILVSSCHARAVVL